MDSLDRMLRTTLLYDTYKSLLTEKQKTYFEDYYFDNLSISEVANKYNVSRNAIHSQLSLLVDELESYEKKLSLLDKDERRSAIIEELKKNAKEEELTLLKKLEEVDV